MKLVGRLGVGSGDRQKTIFEGAALAKGFQRSLLGQHSLHNNADVRAQLFNDFQNVRGQKDRGELRTVGTAPLLFLLSPENPLDALARTQEQIMARGNNCGLSIPETLYAHLSQAMQ